MVFRYSIVPVAYTARGMIDAPMMPGYDLPVAAEVQRMKPAFAALLAKLQAASKAGQPGAAAGGFSQDVPAAQAEPGGFVQDTGPGAFVQDTTIGTMPMGSGLAMCCATEMDAVQNSFGGFSQDVPRMVTPYRSLNLLLSAFHLFSDLASRYQGVTTSFKALKSAPDAPTAVNALAQLSSQLDQMAQSAAQMLPTPLE
jgi:hypothetical protein